MHPSEFVRATHARRKTPHAVMGSVVDVLAQLHAEMGSDVTDQIGAALEQRRTGCMDDETLRMVLACFLASEQVEALLQLLQPEATLSSHGGETVADSQVYYR